MGAPLAGLAAGLQRFGQLRRETKDRQRSERFEDEDRARQDELFDLKMEEFGLQIEILEKEKEELDNPLLSPEQRRQKLVDIEAREARIADDAHNLSRGTLADLEARTKLAEAQTRQLGKPKPGVETELAEDQLKALRASRKGLQSRLDRLLGEDMTEEEQEEDQTVQDLFQSINTVDAKIADAESRQNVALKIPAVDLGQPGPAQPTVKSEEKQKINIFGGAPGQPLMQTLAGQGMFEGGLNTILGGFRAVGRGVAPAIQNITEGLGGRQPLTGRENYVRVNKETGARIPFESTRLTQEQIQKLLESGDIEPIKRPLLPQPLRGNMGLRGRQF